MLGQNNAFLAKLVNLKTYEERKTFKTLRTL